MRRWALGLTATLLGIGLASLTPSAALAHDEREAVAPDGSGSVPTYRTEGPTLLVCKTDLVDFTERIAAFSPELIAENQALWEQCQASGHRDLQAAVDVAQPGTNIKILPGVYQEEPSLEEPSEECANLPARTAALGYQVLSYEQQLACPHNQNLVAVLGKGELQIEGTGAEPEDVVIDAQYRKLNGIRADRANGIYLRNFTVQRTTFNAVYILETDGFVIDTMIGRWNDEYGFLTFADDHGLYTDCEAYGNGDSGLYPGAPANLNKDNGHDVGRYAIEIRNCYSHDNLLGYSGTAGNSVWAHDNQFVHNTAGVATDSAFPGHPGLPQNHALFERNIIANNNEDYYSYVRDGTCAKDFADRGYEDGVVCPAVGVPPGTGVLDPGGDDNLWRGNWVYDNDYAGFVSLSVPGVVRGDLHLSAQVGTPHRNRYEGNYLGWTTEFASAPNRIDFWWDGQGVGSCWQGDAKTLEPLAPPACGAGGEAAGGGTARYVAEPAKLLKVWSCASYDLATATVPSDCEWYGAEGIARAEVRSAVGEAAVLGLVLVFVWWRVLRRWGLAMLGLLLAVGGHVVVVLGTVYEASILAPVGLGVLGAGWVLLGLMLHHARRPGLGFLTAALGVIALLGAVDRGIWMLPYVPVAPSLWRITLEVCWVPTAIVAAIQGRPRRSPSRSSRRIRRPRRTGDPLEDFTAILRL